MNSFNSKLMDLIGNRKRILVTGGSGFIGGHLVRKFLKDSDCIVFNLDKMSYASDNFSIKQLLNKIGPQSENRYKFLKVDLLNEPKLKDALSLADPDIIFHFAAESHVDRSIDNPEEFINSNIVGTYNLLKLSREHFDSLNSDRRNFFRFHHISTDEVFGSLGAKGSFSENSKYDPRSPYSASKAASDHLVKAWFHTYQFPTILTNCSNNFGPWQFPEKLIPLIILKAMAKENIPIYGDGSNVRDWIFVEDHIDGVILASAKGTIGESYCIGGFHEKSNIELAKQICSILDRKIKPEISFSNYIQMVQDRPGHDKRYSIDSSKIQKELFWKPNYSFKDSLETTIEWYLNNNIWINQIKTRLGDSLKRQGLEIK